MATPAPVCSLHWRQIGPSRTPRQKYCSDDGQDITVLPPFISILRLGMIKKRSEARCSRRHLFHITAHDICQLIALCRIYASVLDAICTKFSKTRACVAIYLKMWMTVLRNCANSTPGIFRSLSKTCSSKASVASSIPIIFL